MFEGIFLLQFNKCNSLFFINVQATFVNSIKVIRIEKLCYYLGLI